MIKIPALLGNNISSNLWNVLFALKRHEATGLIVGGSVRDALMEYPSKDMDIEVFNMGHNDLGVLLASFGRINIAGRHFGIYKVTFPDGEIIDVSMPRKENKVGKGHAGFEVEADPTMTIHEAGLRRDFTINTLSYDPISTMLYDYHAGTQDIDRKILRHVSPAFAEDPLRVLRGMRFAGRYGFDMAEETVEMCQSLLPEYSTISKERIWGEWQGFLAKSRVPSKGMKVLQDSGWMALYPEITVMVGLKQDSVWHPEGDVYAHTLHVMDAAARIAVENNLDEEGRVILVLAALCHDMGKAGFTENGQPVTQTNEEGRITSHMHAAVGVPIARNFMKRLGTPESICEAVQRLTAEHMIDCDRGKVTKRVLGRLSARIAPSNIKMLEHIIHADNAGRPPLPASRPAEFLLQMAEDMACAGEPVKGFLRGSDLIERGFVPGKQIGEILKASMEAQNDMLFENRDNALVWLDEYLNSVV